MKGVRMAPDLIEAISAEAAVDQRRWADEVRVLCREALSARAEARANRMRRLRGDTAAPDGAEEGK